MLAEAAQIRSTRETAPSYADAAMRNPTILLPLLFILADGLACKDDEPTGAEFGEPCGYDPETDKTTYCSEGLDCNIGYCDEKCQTDADCQPVESFQRSCLSGICQIHCTEQTLACPQSLDVPLECVLSYCVGAS